MDAGLALGAFVMGLMVDGVGYRSIYLMGAVLVVLAGALYILQMKNAATLSWSPRTKYIKHYISISISPFARQQQGKISPGWTNASGSVSQSTWPDTSRRRQEPQYPSRH